MSRKLKDSTVKHAKASSDGKPASYADGGGLRLVVTETGKYWRYRYRWNDKQNELALGTYPDITLKEARERHEEARALLERGINPSIHKRHMRTMEAEVNTRSFQAIALEWMIVIHLLGQKVTLPV